MPLRADDGLEVGSRAARALDAGLETIWFDEKVKPGLRKRPAQIVLVPLTYYGLQTRLRTAAKRAGIALPRLIHGTRHHAGTTILSKSGNLRIAQQMLGHSDIKSTLRYAHALETDLRAALQGAPGTEAKAAQPT